MQSMCVCARNFLQEILLLRVNKLRALSFKNWWSKTMYIICESFVFIGLFIWFGIAFVALSAIRIVIHFGFFF